VGEVSQQDLDVQGVLTHLAALGTMPGGMICIPVPVAKRVLAILDLAETRTAWEISQNTVTFSAARLRQEGPEWARIGRR
jgi:hypothetical protein